MNARLRDELVQILRESMPQEETHPPCADFDAFMAIWSRQPGMPVNTAWRIAVAGSQQ